MPGRARAVAAVAGSIGIGGGQQFRGDRAAAGGESLSAVATASIDGRVSGSTASMSSRIGVSGPLRCGGGNSPDATRCSRAMVFGVRTEGRRPLQGGVEGRPQGEHVGREGGVGPARDLRGQEGRGAVHQTGGRQGGIAQGVGDAEVADQGVSVVSDQDVARLDVAVDDPDGVGGGQGRGDLRAELGRLVRLQRTALAQHRRQGHRRQELHDQARPALVLHDVEHRDGMPVVQAGGDPGLAHRPLIGQFGVGRRESMLPVQLLHGHRPAEPLVLGLPDGAHPARANQP